MAIVAALANTSLPDLTIPALIRSLTLKTEGNDRMDHFYRMKVIVP